MEIQGGRTEKPSQEMDLAREWVTLAIKLCKLRTAQADKS